MIDGKGHFDAIDAHLPLRKDAAYVVHQDVEPGIALLKLVGQAPDCLLGGEVREQQIDRFVAAVLFDLALGLLSPRAIPADHHHGRPHAGQSHGGGLAYAGVGPGHHADLSLHIGIQCCHGFDPFLFIVRLNER